MDDRLLQERQFMEQAEFLGVDYPSLYMCKSKRGIKREDGGKDAYKLPHRLIEKKRRDRINECIGQLKDLLPEHLKLSTLGHLEKAVVLELTLKHLNALTAVTEQQHQKIIALQNGDRSIKPSSLHADLDAFHSGFQACAKEVLQYLGQYENWAAREQRCAQLVTHLHKVMAHIQSTGSGNNTPPQQQQHSQDSQTNNCVPVIQRTQELNENDTDTDSGYGGEAEKDCTRGGGGPGGGKSATQGSKPIKVKQEFGDERAAKKAKLAYSGSDLVFMNNLMGINNQQQPQQPICMPFYFINPSAAASYLPFFDKNSLEKLMYPSAAAALSPFPWLYPAAAAAAFPGLTTHLASPSSSSSSSPSSSQQPKDTPPLPPPPRPSSHLPGSPEEEEEEELEDSPVSEEEGDVEERSQESSASSNEQFPACPTS